MTDALKSVWGPMLALCLLGGCTNGRGNNEEAPVPTAPALEQPGGSSATSGEGFQTTASGLKYKILREGTGKSPSATDTVEVHYRGWLDNGKEFDSSYKRGEPISFRLNGVIPGWTEGLQLVSEGGKIELEIPSELGYGARGAPPDIPPHSTLHFEVELLAVK